jgi:hypothetical protein
VSIVLCHLCADVKTSWGELNSINVFRGFRRS